MPEVAAFERPEIYREPLGPDQFLQPGSEGPTLISCAARLLRVGFT
jgi:hypothetical protein